MAGSGFIFRVQAAAGRTYVVEESTDSLAWSVLQTNIATGPLELTVPFTPTCRTYRARAY